MFLGKNIKLIRELEKLSQEEFGERIGVTRDAVYTYESRNTMPKQVTLSRLVKEFRVPLDTLINAELTEEQYREYKTTDPTNSTLNESETLYNSKHITREEYIIYLESRVKKTEAKLDSIILNLDGLLANQRVIAAMNEAAHEALLSEVAERRGLKSESFLRNVRNKAISKLRLFATKGIAVGADM